MKAIFILLFSFPIEMNYIVGHIWRSHKLFEKQLEHTNYPVSVGNAIVQCDRCPMANEMWQQHFNLFVILRIGVNSFVLSVLRCRLESASLASNRDLCVCVVERTNKRFIPSRLLCKLIFDTD